MRLLLAPPLTELLAPKAQNGRKSNTQSENKTLTTNTV